ncbi:unnamed protein product [Allacma fusca]|uniref:Carboxylesterase type B domain-containing protein n=1 Tax=Allacma fusca TaxID=39272 RepID=A0A8J2NVR5_9HEXA|nr:unnamed protein product [Allacma fusca]
MFLNLLILTGILLGKSEGRVIKNNSSSISDEQATKLTRFPRVLTASESGQAQWTTVVTTKNGMLRGSVMKSRKNKDYIAFRGVQYAKVNGRFEESTPLTPWANIKDALEFGFECPQCETCGYTVANTDEDCLYLNVYIPDLRPTQNELAVVMFIPDGYYHGTGSAFGADYFMDEEVILVTINYRLGILGFLNTGDGIIPGNNGLRDMIMALKWIDENIRYFSGDPIRITVFGESGSSAHFLMLSPASKGSL